MLLLGILFRLLLPPSCSTCGSGRIAAMAMGCENNLKLSCEIVQLGAGSILRSQRMEELSSLRSWGGTYSDILQQYWEERFGSCAREQQLFGDKYLAMNVCIWNRKQRQHVIWCLYWSVFSRGHRTSGISSVG